MLRKKETLTVITPIPSFIPRQLALDILHSHSEVITLNPLVLDHKPIPAPRDAASDEFYSTWYRITEKIQLVPGVGNMGASKITFNGCFHDMPWGLQTHIYAPFNIDLRYRYQIAGNQPGIESPERREIGLQSLGAPADGLYLRQDIAFKCNIAMAGFVKSQAKAANRQMVERIVKKAELLDAGILQAMMLDGKLKTINPNDLSQSARNGNRNSAGCYNPSPVHSPRPASWAQRSSCVGPYQTPESPESPESPTRQNCQLHQAQAQHGFDRGKEMAAPVELPGDSQHYQYYRSQPQPLASQPQDFALDYRQSVSCSDPGSSQGHLSPCPADTKRLSMSSTASGAGSMPHISTALVSELATHTDTKVGQ
ncbi:hypothetical protein E4U43_004750 [Claviceps pusilla]|uniref:DUF7053 domain-containing protein n=1 Tax=Claviceps pusilla TaxID=123648 RepID=A0A9P7SVX4_9HYPO|nr:hypothetical protein E4U43_004750 [Claviceps pusilla]